MLRMERTSRPGLIYWGRNRMGKAAVVVLVAPRHMMSVHIGRSYRPSAIRRNSTGAAAARLRPASDWLDGIEQEEVP
jgi:hypothetical protein